MNIYQRAFTILISGLACGCFPTTTTYMEIDYSTDNINFVEEEIQILTNPMAMFRSEGCGRSFGLVSPPVIFNVVVNADVSLSKGEDAYLIVGDQHLKPLIFDNVNVWNNTLTRRYAFNKIRCADLKNASVFILTGLKVNDESLNKEIWIRYKEHTVTELRGVPWSKPH